MAAKIQTAFHAGEWSPSLYARVDMAKYHSAAALLRNYFVDYRGGASSRPGTKYVLQGFQNTIIRLIPFQLTPTSGYILEFGDGYIRFFFNGAPVLEPALAITNITHANPAVAAVANTYGNFDVVYVTGVGGMTQVNNRYYSLSAVTPGTVQLNNLRGTAIDATGYGFYTAGGTMQRVYKIASPYAAGELAALKFVKNGNKLYLDHPNHPPFVLTINSATSWTIASLTIGSTVTTPGGTGIATTLGAGAVNYAYMVTAVDASGQESLPTAPILLANILDIRTNPGTITVTWAAVTGAASYNAYRAAFRYGAAVPAGAAFGFMGNVSGTAFIDSNQTDPDFSQTPPVSNNPFSGSGVSGIAVTAGGTYTVVPVVGIGPPGIGGVQAQAIAVMQATNVTLSAAGVNFTVGDTINLPSGIVVGVSSVDGAGHILGIVIPSLGSTTTSIPSNPVPQSSTSGFGSGSSFNITWTVSSIQITVPGSVYGAPPAVSFTPAGAAATASVGASPLGNPSVPGIFDQRLIHAAPSGSGLAFFGSQPGQFTNYNYSSPLQPDDSITSALISDQVTTIKAMVPMPSGLLIFTDKNATQLYGTGPGTAISAVDLTTNPQSYVGISDMPPIVANKNVLFVQQKGSIVRDLEYNYYANIYTGTDISVLSSHLFYGYQLKEWAWAEEPYKIVWATRNDGSLLSLTYLKEQELIGWAHHDTQGSFQSVATVTENVNGNIVDAVYFVTERFIGGSQYPYIERMDDRFWANYVTPWCVDAGLQSIGVTSTTFRGLDHLAGLTVVGLGDGVPITPTVVSADGVLTLANAVSNLTVGLPFRPQLQTLPLDLGEPTVQGKRKSIDAITVKVWNTLGLSIGGDSTTLVPMKGLILGNLNEYLNAAVSNLVSADARTLSDPNWTVPGQVFIDQPNPYPSTILGVVPEFEIGDDYRQS